MAETITLCEIFLPVYFFGINLHMLLHTCAPEGSIMQLGPPCVHQCYDQERMGGIFVKQKGYSNKNFIAGITKKYLIGEKLRLSTFTRNLTYETDYMSSDITICPGPAIKDFKSNDPNLCQLAKQITGSDEKNLMGNLLSTFTINGIKFTTEEFSDTSRKNHNNSYVKIKTELMDEYGIIKKIFFPNSLENKERLLFVEIQWMEREEHKRQSKKSIAQDSFDPLIKVKIATAYPLQWIQAASIYPMNVSCPPMIDSKGKHSATSKYVLEWPEFLE
jgi:hypothetical protein